MAPISELGEKARAANLCWLHNGGLGFEPTAYSVETSSGVRCNLRDKTSLEALLREYRFRNEVVKFTDFQD